MRAGEDHNTLSSLGNPTEMRLALIRFEEKAPLAAILLLLLISGSISYIATLITTIIIDIDYLYNYDFYYCYYYHNSN